MRVSSPSLKFIYINKIQQDATICRYLFTAKLFYMLRVPSHPSSRAHKTVTAASGTGRVTYQVNDLYQKLRLQFYVLLMMGAMAPQHVE